MHNPFPSDAVTITSFNDDVLVLSSLQRPRKLTVRGSDGRSYGLLCKPKDDLRKDQRLMEFNAMINRALQRDIDSSKRRLYIKTYGVTPLNEECGTIEWVEGLKPMRDIIIKLYKNRNISVDYNETKQLLAEACSDISRIGIFTDHIMKKFSPVLHEWFIETFPEPEAWFAARLRYTRSCAVMSIVGHVLGLGDRHGENVLLEEGNGGTFHVDFNCLFDKGLTFEKPELVPFRLTDNMVDAMGPQGVEGPFRKAAELTYAQLRQHEDTLITILETFVHDPTADFLGKKRRKNIPGVPETPQEVLETVRMKVDGIMKGETVPLSVEGYVDALIAMARDPMNLASMYIGWCAFF
jgi:serine/threonine-protein kinase ATR